ncbi:MAG: adenylyltransferase/cytidyltransferase family protein [bacterium]
MKKVFVSGCYDILHAGHVQFFEDAKNLGDYLIVSFASAEVLRLAKNREAAMPDDHKRILISAIRYVDKAIVSSDLDPVFDFLTSIKKEKPDILVVTEDDRNKDRKKDLCQELGIELVVLPKRICIEPTSTTEIRSKLKI